MTKRNAVFIILLFFLLACGFGAPCNATGQAVKTASIEGVWQGTVTNGNQTVLFVIQVEKHGDNYSGSFQVPDRSAEVRPLSMLVFKDGSLHFAFAALAIKWDGKLVTAGTRLVGNASDGVSTYPLNFSINSDAHVFERPQEPKDPLPYSVQEVQFVNAPARIALAGTLTLPKSTGPFPAVVVLSGAGQLDRDGANYGHKPFLVIADFLTRRGIAVLRVDDRGVGGSEGDPAAATVADFASDVSSSAAYLKSRHDIGKVGVIGCGIGGAIAPISASRSTDVGFVVMLGVPALDGRRILAAQTDMMTQASGAAIEEINMIRRFQARAFGILIAIKNPEAASTALISAMTDEISNLPQGRRVAWLKLMSAMTRSYNTAWMRYFTGFDPAPFIKAIGCPALSLYGETDQEVLSSPNYQAMESALQQSRTKDYKLQIETGLNHLFQTSKSGASAEYEQINETISPVALKTVGDWITEHAK